MQIRSAGASEPLLSPGRRQQLDRGGRVYLNRRLAKLYKLLLHVCHSCAVPGEMYR